MLNSFSHKWLGWFGLSDDKESLYVIEYQSENNLAAGVNLNGIKLGELQWKIGRTEEISFGSSKREGAGTGEAAYGNRTEGRNAANPTLHWELFRNFTALTFDKVACLIEFHCKLNLL